jgi:D-threonate/D-erythronate kinase
MTSSGLLIVADDLTGALDSACEAASRSIATRVFLSPTDLEAARGTVLPPVVAVSTNSRDGSPQAARHAMAQVCANLAWLPAPWVMKKVDSRLKGHVALETRMLMEATGAARITAVPALPDMGRVQVAGRLGGAGIPEPIQIAQIFQGMVAEIPDVTSSCDVAAAARSPGLMVGARSLAAALVRQIWPQADGEALVRLTAPGIMVIGSRDPITMAQVERLGRPRMLCPNGNLGDDIPEGRLSVVQMVQAEGPAIDPRKAGDLFAQGLASRLLQDLPSSVIVVGGETAAALMRQMGVRHLDVIGAALPGIPVSHAALADGRRFTLITKSGGFGDHETLARLAQFVDN